MLVADEATVRDFLNPDPTPASAKGGPYGCDALTYSCFSRYLRPDAAKSEAFVRTARALLDAGANANTGRSRAAQTTDEDAMLGRLLREYAANVLVGQPSGRLVVSRMICGASGCCSVNEKPQI